MRYSYTTVVRQLNQGIRRCGLVEPARIGDEKSQYVYSFIKSQMTDRICLQSKYKLYEIRPTGPARRLATR